MKKVLMSLLLAVFVGAGVLPLVPTPTAVAQGATVSVRNGTGEDILYAIAWYNPAVDRRVSEGWWMLKPGETSFEIRSANGAAFFYAKSSDGEYYWWREDHGWWIHPYNGFSIVDGISNKKAKKKGYGYRPYYASETDKVFTLRYDDAMDIPSPQGYIDVTGY